MKEINELLEKLYSQGVNKYNILEYTHLLIKYYSIQKKLNEIQDKVDKTQIYNKDAVKLQYAIKDIINKSTNNDFIKSQLNDINIKIFKENDK